MDKSGNHSYAPQSRRLAYSSANIQDNEAEQIRKDNDVAFSSWYDSINANAEQDYYIGGKNAVIYGIEEAYSTNIMNYPTEGNYPQNEKKWY